MPRQLSDAERARRAEAMRILNADPEFIARRDAARALSGLNGGRKSERKSEAQRRRWADPEYRAAQLKRMQSPEFLARQAEGRKRRAGRKNSVSPDGRDSHQRAARISGARRSNGVSVAVPKWVPDDLIDDYCATSVLYGEEMAATRVRAMKREVERA